VSSPYSLIFPVMKRIIRKARYRISHWSLIHAVQSSTAFFRPCKVPSDDHYSHAQTITAPPENLHPFKEGNTSDI